MFRASKIITPAAVVASLPLFHFISNISKAECSDSGEKRVHQPAFRTTTTRNHPKGSRNDSAVTLDSMVLLSGSAHRDLAQEVSEHIKVPLCKASLTRFADGEVSVQIQEYIRGKDIFIIQSCAAPVNDSIMELLLTVSCARRADARRIIAVIPYFGYKHHRRGNHISTKHSSRFLSSGAADFATMLMELGVDRIIAVDLQRPGQGHDACFFDNAIPVETILTNDLFIDTIVKNGLLQEPVTIVAPNAECFKKARTFQAVLQKHYKKTVKLLPYFADDAGSGPSDVEKLKAHGSANLTIDGGDVLIVDDMIDTAITVSSLSARLKEAGARKVVVAASHGILNDQSVDVINKSQVDKILVCDTLPLPINKCNKIVRVPIAAQLAHVILTEHFRTIDFQEEQFSADD